MIVLNILGLRIKSLREARGLTQTDLSIVLNDQFNLNIDRVMISKWETGFQVPVMNTIVCLAKFFNVSIDYLNGIEAEVPDDLSQYGIMPITTKRIPFLGEIACGEPIFANEDRESYIDVGTDIKADFCLKCRGNSMINARINDGDIVFIRKQPEVNNGEIAAVIIDDTATLKRVYYYPNTYKLVLIAENPEHEPQMYVGEELEQVRILGKAVAFQSDVI